MERFRNFLYNFLCIFLTYPVEINNNVKIIKQKTEGECGLACYQMVLNFNNFKISYESLKIYFENYEVIGENGTIYSNLVNLSQELFNIESAIIRTNLLKRLKFEIKKGNIVMASVNHHKYFNKRPKGGHLILLNGYSDVNKCFYIKDPSNFLDSSYEEMISYEDFKQIFAGRGVSFKNIK